MKLFGFVFDLDGTLVNSLGDIAGIVNQLRVELGAAPLSAESLHPYIGHGATELIEGAFKDIEDPPPIEDLVSRYRDGYQTFALCGEVYPGVKEVLRVLAQEDSVKLAVATNKPTSAAKKSLAHYLPEISFDAIVGPDAVTHKKPDPAHLLEALSKIGVSPQDAVFVGDHDVDRECAVSAGVSFFAAAYGMSGVKAPESQQLRHFAELMEKVPEDRYKSG